MTKIKSINSLRKLDVAKEVQLYLERYLKGEVDVKFIKTHPKRFLTVYQMNNKLDEKELARGEAFYDSPFDGGHFSDYVIGLGKQCIDLPLRENILIGLVGIRGSRDYVGVVAELYRHDFAYNTQFPTNKNFFGSIEEYLAIVGILREFKIYELSKVSYLLGKDKRRVNPSLLTIGHAIVDERVTKASELESRVNEVALAANSVSEYLDMHEQRSIDIGRKFVKKYVSRLNK